jgi:hypothetical protein
MTNKIEQIHESMMNGQGRQAVEQMNEYGVYDFAEAYLDYLTQTNMCNPEDVLRYFSDAIITRDRIISR